MFSIQRNDYVYLSQVWLNMYPQRPAWRHVGVVKDGVGTAGANTQRFAKTHGDAPAADG
ncbi:hypothetical protein MY5147_006012 [Beauveria neobassiana]